VLPQEKDFDRIKTSPKNDYKANVRWHVRFLRYTNPHFSNNSMLLRMQKLHFVFRLPYIGKSTNCFRPNPAWCLIPMEIWFYDRSNHWKQLLIFRYFKPNRLLFLKAVLRF